MLFPARVLAFFPSSPGSQISLGPLHLRAYGVLIALGVVAAVWLAERRWVAGGGAAGTMSSLALWAVPAGLIGARLYHVATDYELYTHHPLDAFKVWQGGLGIWGGVAGGVFVGCVVGRRRGLDMRRLMDAAAPALPLAQAIGRWGNYFNQELFGRPSKLPWALRVDPAYRPKGFAQYATFHPTFLYESLWDLAVVGLLLLAERKLRIRRGYLFVLYVALYTFGRFWTEYLRIDFAHKFLGLRLNDWVSILIFAAATLLLVLRGRIRSGEADGDGGAGSDGGDPGEAAAVAVRGAEEPGPARATAESADQAAPGPGPGPAEP